MLDLSALLAGAMATKAKADVAKADQRKLRHSKLTTKERDEIAAKVRKWESSAEYVAVGLTARFLRYTCQHCGSTHEGGGQMLLQEKHLRRAGEQRWIKAPLPWPESLKVSIDAVEVECEVCLVCVDAL